MAKFVLKYVLTQISQLLDGDIGQFYFFPLLIDDVVEKSDFLCDIADISTKASVCSLR